MDCKKLGKKMNDKILETATIYMNKCIKNFSYNLLKIRTGRASSGLIDHISIKYHGNNVLISKLANIYNIDSRTLGISPWEKELLPKIEKAIQSSELGLNPLNLGETLRIPIPPISGESRKKIIKIVKKELEKSKVSIRNVRRDINNTIKKKLLNREISSDYSEKIEKYVQTLTNKMINNLIKIYEDKEKELNK